MKDVAVNGWLCGRWNGLNDQLEVRTPDGMKKIADLPIGTEVDVLMEDGGDDPIWNKGVIVSTTKQATFMGTLCDIRTYNYANGRTALQLFDVENDEPFTTATVNVPEAHLEKDEILIKNYSENEGLLDVLVAANIVKDTGRTIPVGFTKAHICILL